MEAGANTSFQTNTACYPSSSNVTFSSKSQIKYFRKMTKNLDCVFLLLLFEIKIVCWCEKLHLDGEFNRNRSFLLKGLVLIRIKVKCFIYSQIP